MELDTAELRTRLEERLAQTETALRELGERLAKVEEEEVILHCKLQILEVVELVASEGTHSPPGPSRDLRSAQAVTEPASDAPDVRDADSCAQLTLGSGALNHPKRKSLMLRLWEAEARSMAAGRVPFPAADGMMHPPPDRKAGETSPSDTHEGARRDPATGKR